MIALNQALTLDASGAGAGGFGRLDQPRLEGTTLRSPLSGDGGQDRLRSAG